MRIGALILLVCLPAVAPASDSNSLRALLAHPETAGFGLSFRGTLRGILGMRIPIVRTPDEGGIGFELHSYVELHNSPESDQGLPNENWRAFVALDTTWRWYFPTGALRRVDFSVAIQHESDHYTSREAVGLGQLNMNDVRFRAEMLFPLGDAGFLLATEIRVFVITCTNEPLCGDFSGNSTGGGAVDLMFDLKAAVPNFRGWSFFASLHAGGILPLEKIREERRLIVRTGARSRSDLGQWQIYGIFWLGNTVGINRNQVVINGGGGFRYTF